MSLPRPAGRSRRRPQPSAIVLLAASAALAGALAGVPGAVAEPAAAPGRPVPAAATDRSGALGGAAAASGRAANLDLREAAERRDSVTPAQRSYAASLGPYAHVAIDPLTGTPDDVSLLRGYLTGASDRSAASVVRRYLRAHAAGLGLATADLSTLRLT